MFQIRATWSSGCTDHWRLSTLPGLLKLRLTGVITKLRLVRKRKVVITYTRIL